MSTCTDTAVPMTSTSARSHRVTRAPAPDASRHSRANTRVSSSPYSSRKDAGSSRSSRRYGRISGPPRRQAARPRQPHEIGQPLRLGPGDFAPERRNPVVAPPFIVLFGRGPVVELHHQTILEHALQRAIQRGGTNADAAIRPSGNGLNDGVAVRVVLGKRHQDVEHGRRQRALIRAISIHDGYSLTGVRRATGWPVGSV